MSFGYLLYLSQRPLETYFQLTMVKASKQWRAAVGSPIITDVIDDLEKNENYNAFLKTINKLKYLLKLLLPR